MPRKDGQFEGMAPTPEQVELLRSLPHRVQSAIAFLMSNAENSRQRYPECEPKHLRVGVNSAMIEASAMGRLLMSKGIITSKEYYDSLILLWQEELRSYQDRLHQIDPRINV